MELPPDSTSCTSSINQTLADEQRAHSRTKDSLNLMQERYHELNLKLLHASQLLEQAQTRANQAEAKLQVSGEHCSTCICGRTAAVQAERAASRGPGSISWEEHLEAYNDYALKYGTSQSAERLAQRGGFSYSELVHHLKHEPKTWKPTR